jgi:hypothetical protein
MVAVASQRTWKRTMNFSVMNNYKPVPFAVHWKFKNITGVTPGKDGRCHG